MASPAEQRYIDQSEIKIKLIRNGVLVKTRKGWFSFPNWNEASIFIGTVVAELSAEDAARKQA